MESRNSQDLESSKIFTHMSSVSTSFILAPVSASKKLCKTICLTAVPGDKKNQNSIKSNKQIKYSKEKVNPVILRKNSSSYSSLPKFLRKNSKQESSSDIALHEFTKNSKIVTREDIINFHRNQKIQS
ncbi:hypothetical protein QEN19_000160 [Hanseniaspora menglaensis]